MSFTMKKGKVRPTEDNDMAVMKDMVLSNLSWYTSKEIAQCIQEGIFTLKDVQIQMQLDLVWEDKQA